MTNEDSSLKVSNTMTVHQPTSEVMAVNLRDWHRIREDIGKIPTKSNGFTSAGWASFGVAASAGMQLISLAASNAEVATWLTIVTAVAFATGLAVGIISIIFAYIRQNDHDDAKERIRREMDDLIPEILRRNQ